jgi:hypothetical protein
LEDSRQDIEMRWGRSSFAEPALAGKAREDKGLGARQKVKPAKGGQADSSICWKNVFATQAQRGRFKTT